MTETRERRKGGGEGGKPKERSKTLAARG